MSKKPPVRVAVTGAAGNIEDMRVNISRDALLVNVTASSENGLAWLV